MPPLQALLLSSLKAPHASSRSPRVALHEASWAAAIRPTAPHRALGLPLCPFRGNGPCSLLATPPQGPDLRPGEQLGAGRQRPFQRGPAHKQLFTAPTPETFLPFSPGSGESGAHPGTLLSCATL